jgi:hypothetical protein
MRIATTFIPLQYILIPAIIWLIVDLAWVSRWSALIARISKLFRAPWIFEKDTEAQEHLLYPRKFLEQLAQNNISGGRGGGSASGTGSGDNLDKWWKALGNRVLGDVSPLVAIGHVLNLVFFLFFIYADAVTVANTLVLIGVEGALPPILQRLDLAILGGALVSATVGVWVFIEMLGKGEFLATDKMGKGQKRVFSALAVLITLFSVAVMLALAGQRMISLGIWASTPQVEFIISFSLYGLLAINSSLAAAVTFASGAQGIVVILLLLSIVIGLVMPILIFLFDLLWRGVIVVLDVAFWAIITPLMALPVGFAKLFHLGKPGQI